MYLVWVLLVVLGNGLWIELSEFADRNNCEQTAAQLTHPKIQYLCIESTPQWTET